MKQGWQIKKLGEVCDIINGRNQKAVECADGQYPIYGSGGNVMGYASDYLCEAGTTIIGRKGSINNPIYIDTKFWNVDTAFGISSKPMMSSKFVYYFCKSFDFSKLNKGTTLPSLVKKDLLLIDIPVPPLSEQQRIVSLLDAEFAKIDALKANAEKNLQNAKDLFQAASDLCFNDKHRYPIMTMGKVCDFVRGPFGGSLKKSCFVEEGYPVYEQQNAIYSKFTFRYFVNENKYNEMRRFSVHSGDIIMSCSGTIGKVALVPIDAPVGIINQALLKLSTKSTILPNYLKMYMESMTFNKQISEHSQGAAIKNVASVAVLKELSIPVPTMEEQNTIVARLEDLNEKCKTLQANYEKTLSLCDDLKQALLRKAFNGEI